MTTIKKDYVAIVELLQANTGKKVEDILPLVLELVSAKTIQSTTRYNDKKELTHVFCYYHKVWEEVAKVPYGAKAGTKTGLNTMCKLGTSCWTKQQAEAKKAKADLLTQVGLGKVPAEEIPTKLAEIEAKRQAIIDVVEPVLVEAELTKPAEKPAKKQKATI